MAELPFLWVDAFTERAYKGNACAIVLDADGLSESAMLTIAREMNLSETAFVMRSTQADFRVRYFTPEREIPLAGHPTIATSHALIESGRFVPTTEGRLELSLELRDGPIRVELQPRTDGSSYEIVMVQRKPQFQREYDRARVARIFGLAENDLRDGVPVQTVSTGTPMLMVPVRNLEVLRRIEMKEAEYRELRSNGDFFSPHLFCLEGATPAGRTFARHLGTFPDTLEDAFTGSATGSMAAYLWKYGLLSSASFTAEQGHWMGRPGSASVEVCGPRDAVEAVRVGGRAATVIRGVIHIEDVVNLR